MNFFNQQITKTHSEMDMKEAKQIQSEYSNNDWQFEVPYQFISIHINSFQFVSIRFNSLVHVRN
jgi:hypothetical protein